ncbi:MAG: xanthine dehydrogenase family protein subunit M [Pseudomonadota bacterium]|nr:xanthine dehydrogenase family protein subunit M [Pseudomonadota bacterium]
MKAPELGYKRAESVGQVIELLASYGDDARVLAGGQSLMPTLNMRLSKPKLLVDINQLNALKGISFEDGIVRVGALARHAEIMRSTVIFEKLPLIAEAMPYVAHVAIRNRGTFGGSIALADPAAELPACVLALGATIVVESARGQREIPASDYFKGLFETERRPDELLIEVRIPSIGMKGVHVFSELSRRQGDFAVAGVACAAEIDGDTISSARLVYFASEDRPTLATNAVTAITNKVWSEGSRASVLDALGDDLDPMENLQGSSEFKLHLQRVLTGRVLDEAIARARAR